MSKSHEITTLGRGGSDTSAVALAIALNAKKVEFYKDVEGIYEEDPKIYLNIKKLDEIDFQKALSIANKRKILHKRAIFLSQKNQIDLHVLSFQSEHANNRETLIKERSSNSCLKKIYEI